MYKILSLCLVLALTVSCKDNSSNSSDLKPLELALSSQQKALVQSSSSFGVDLFMKVAPFESQNNMLSPLSASVALTMLLNGTQDKTQTQIKEMLGYGSETSLEEVNSAYKNLVEQILSADTKVQLSIANALFAKQGFDIKASYLNVLKTDFKAEVENLDFSKASSVTRINKWAADNTNNKITNVIQAIDPNTVLFLLNALYFKADWSNQFEESKTIDKPFYLKNGNQIQASTMVGTVNSIRVSRPDFIAIELPYGRKNFSMIIFLPNDSIQDFYSIFDSAIWNEVSSALSEQTEWTPSIIELPKFKFEYEKNLNEVLKALGMLDAFDSSVANLKGINETADLFVSFVKQNTFVEVNEKGTEAAAVTTIGISLTSAGPDQIPIYKVNKPFVFAIRERSSNTLLFLGNVNNPDL